MRILIIGAGIAGMTLAALLDRRGVQPRVIERSSSTHHAGYMLGLYALGHRVLHGLGLYDAFVAQSVECKHYVSYDDHGARISEWSLEPIAGKYGPLLSCTRPQLIELLRGGLGGVQVELGRHATAIDASHPDEVHVTFDDGSTATFDLVVGADGLGSSTRKLVMGEQPRFETGWGGFVWWADHEVCPPETFVEFWGAGRFLGLYPTTRGVGVFAGAPVEGGFDHEEGRRARLHAKLAGMGERVDRVLASLPPDGEELFFWQLSDVRSSEWVQSRVVLLGDASTGFLPTAGIGASMAMESAAVLADELSRTNPRFLDHSLELYVKRRKARVEAIQNDSRKLARIMFVSSPSMTAIRNYVSRFVTLEMAMGSITKAFEQPI